MTNNIRYSGEVTVKINNKHEYKFTNKGTDILFTSLSNMLLGNTSSKPTYITIGTVNNDDGNIIVNPILFQNIVISSKRMEGTACVFEGLLTYTAINSNGSIDTSLCIVMLDNKKRVLAYVQDNELAKTVSDILENYNSQAVIKWTMSFSNK